VNNRYTVLHTIETSGTGGAETVMLDIATRLDRSRFRSIAALPAPGPLQGELEARGIQTFLVPSGRWWDGRLPLGLARICRREGVSLIHAHLPEHSFYGCLAARLARCPTVATYHGQLDLWRAQSWRGAAKLRLVRKSASAVVAVCDTVREALVHHDFRREDVLRIYNGVDSHSLRADRGAGLRELFGWPADTQIIGTIANVRVSKGYDHLVRAARRVVDHIPTARFIAAGDIDPILGAPILKLVEDLGLKEHVRFLGFRADVPQLLRDFDLFVLPSTSEGFPLALLEAMTCGKAVIATRCGGPEELVRDGVNGHLVPVGDVESLAERIVTVLSNAEHAARLKAAAVDTAIPFTTDAMVYDYQVVYDRLLRRKLMAG
jgi:glycosyltransferase involved in cell wall biosynthesis